MTSRARAAQRHLAIETAAPLASNVKRSFMRSSSMRGDITRDRAAASSIASGSPSSSFTSVAIAASSWPRRRDAVAGGDGTPLEEARAFVVGHRREHLRVLARDAEHLAAGDDEAGLGRKREPAAERRLGVPGDLLEGVENDEARAVRGDRRADLLHRVGLAERHVERLGDDGDDAVDAARRRQVAEPRRRRDSRRARRARGEGRAASCRCRRCRARDEPSRPVEERGQRLQRVDPADEDIALGGKVVGGILRAGAHSLSDVHDAIRLGRIGGGSNGALALAALEQLLRLGDALEPPVAVAAQPARPRASSAWTAAP